MAESTTIALLARISGLLEPLKDFVRTRAVWGTCAGAIMLSQAVTNEKKGGQELLGGISVAIARNGWGSQVRNWHMGLPSQDEGSISIADRVFRGQSRSGWPSRPDRPL